jgi:hypothetical protein
MGKMLETLRRADQPSRPREVFPAASAPEEC